MILLGVWLNVMEIYSGLTLLWSNFLAVAIIALADLYWYNIACNVDSCVWCCDIITYATFASMYMLACSWYHLASILTLCDLRVLFKIWFKIRCRYADNIWERIFAIYHIFSLRWMAKQMVSSKSTYRKTPNISRTLVGNIIDDNSDVVGASPVGAAPTTSSFST